MKRPLLILLVLVLAATLAASAATAATPSCPVGATFPNQVRRGGVWAATIQTPSSGALVQYRVIGQGWYPAQRGALKGLYTLKVNATSPANTTFSVQATADTGFCRWSGTALVKVIA